MLYKINILKNILEGMSLEYVAHYERSLSHYFHTKQKQKQIIYISSLAINRHCFLDIYAGE